MLPNRRTVLFTALLAFAACTGPADSTATPSPAPASSEATLTATPTASPRFTPPATATPEPRPTPIVAFTVGEHVLEDVELLVFSVRYRDTFPSDQSPDRLDRLYRGDDGEIRIEDVPFPEDPDGHSRVLFINPITADPSGEELAATICVQGDCGGFTSPSDDAMTAIYRSSDRGDTWRREVDLKGSIRVVGWSDGEFVLWRAAPDGGKPPPADEQFWRYPSGEPLVAPTKASGESPQPSHYDSPYGPLWSSDDGFLDSEGLLAVPFPAAIGKPARVEFLAAGRRFWTWTPTGADPGDLRHAAVFDAAGTQLTPTLQVPYGCCTATPDGRLLVPGVAPLPEWIDAYRDELPKLQNGEPYGRFVPGFLDPETGAIEAITDPFLRAVYRNRDQIRVIAVLPAAPIFGDDGITEPRSAEGTPFSGVDLARALAADGLRYGPQDFGVGCMGARSHGQAWGGPSGPDFTLWVYPTSQALGEDWALPLTGPPRTRLEGCPLSRGFAYWNENLLLDFHAPRNWDGRDALRQRIVDLFLALDP